MTNPVFNLAGADSPSKVVTLTFFDGEIVTTRGTDARAWTTAADSMAAYADAGWMVWFNLDGHHDEGKVEYVTVDGASRRVLVAQRVTGSRGWNTVKAVCTDQPVQMHAAPRDFAPADFSPDFAI